MSSSDSDPVLDESDDGWISSDEFEFEPNAFEHCVLNFCGDDYDDRIQASLASAADYYNDSRAPADVGVENMKAQMQNYIRAVRTGDFNSQGHLHVKLHPFSDVDRTNMYKPSRMLPHEESLNWHWDLFLNLIPHYSNERGRENIFSFSICNAELTKETLQLMATQLNGKVKDTLRFEKNNLCSDGIISIASLLESNPTVGCLSLPQNPINNLNAAKRLSEAVSSHSNIWVIDLEGCCIGNNNDILLTILKSGATQIKLVDNNIGSQGGITIANYLRSNAPTVRVLDLSNNSLNDGNATPLANALMENTTLCGISVAGNKFTSTGVKSLFRAVFNSSSMNTIYESNHLCSLLLLHTQHTDIFHTICGQPDDGGHHFYHLDLNSLDLSIRPKDSNRMQKLLLALHSKESILGYLENLPLELMPNVFEFIWRGLHAIQTGLRDDCDRNKLMNMMYSIMRWWDMPTLYSYHRCNTSSCKRKLGAI